MKKTCSYYACSYGSVQTAISVLTVKPGKKILKNVNIFL